MDYNTAFNSIEDEDLKEEKPSICKICGEIFVNQHEYSFHVKQKCNSNSDYGRKNSVLSTLTIYSDRNFNLGCKRDISETVKEKIKLENDCDPTSPDEHLLPCTGTYKDYLNSSSELSDQELSECEQKTVNIDLNEGNTNEKLYSCEVCGKTFQYLYRVKRHMLTHSGEKSYCCELCGKAFARKYTLVKHQLVHTSERPHECGVCGKAFKHGSHLKDHVETHSDEKPYSCEECNAMFKRKSSLTSHLISVHSTDCPYSCKDCGKTFKQKYMLVAHQLVHAKERPFLCEVCGKAFKSQHYIKVHLRTHSGERLCACKVCGKGCRDKTRLREHMKVHEHKISCYACDECGRTFKNQGRHKCVFRQMQWRPNVLM